MQVRIRLMSSSRVRCQIRYPVSYKAHDKARYKTLALAVSSLLIPCALIAFTLAFWSIAADMRWSTTFFVSTGLFSHWEVWLASAGLLLLLARILGQDLPVDGE
ncbi:MAG TPA: hypothetical protein VGG97_15765 [Bryobacteraceae bacterium]